MKNKESKKKILSTRSKIIADELSRRIVNKVYLPGEKLPTERELAEEFQATRHSIREALKRLEALGLVKIRQGSGIIAQDIDLIGGLELFDTLIKDEQGNINLSLLKDILEFRDHMVRQVVRLAAERHTQEELDELRYLFQKRKSFIHNQDELQKINERFFKLFAQATRNQIYELLYNTMWQAFLKINEMVDILLIGKQKLDRLAERILEAFESRDGELAELILSRHLEFVQQQFEISLKTVEKK
ncbi:MAG TPA: GntR family transcriptional regulator [Candidatus Hydrogenedens sp.]|nr:GntR family transcriptional regulator [Candidatus Hydrogenedens sp.]HOK08782.1 GntR family transcriptional regulator [Candidatus Hydrogenedens sp.]HOL20649.1 GntR family transcriptional regulator [Candidatus Hydrogenedens sp.]HPP58471.1 GntR family transcriptional regulator [Candidatus Hydrogenedens sp.]